jgi:hypothetical protein
METIRRQWRVQTLPIRSYLLNDLPKMLIAVTRNHKTHSASTTNRILSTLVAVIWMASFIQFAGGEIVAFDDASQPVYTNGWQAGDNGGAGFGPWFFAFSGNGNGLVHPPQFIDTGPLPANSLGAPAFALTTGDQNNQFETSDVQRTFTTPMAVGQTFSADVNGSAISNAPAFTTGNTFDLLGTNGSERFSLFTNNGYHNDRWTSTGDADTGIPAGNSFHIDFKLVDTNMFDLMLSPIGGGAPYFTQTGVALAGTSGVAINRLRVRDYGTGSSTNGSKELFFDNLTVTSPDIPGDFNKDQKVDAADYVVWRKDGLDAADYSLWRSHFGESASASASLINSLQSIVPEPTAATLILMFEFVHVLFRPLIRRRVDIRKKTAPVLALANH